MQTEQQKQPRTPRRLAKPSAPQLPTGIAARARPLPPPRLCALPVVRGGARPAACAAAQPPTRPPQLSQLPFPLPCHLACRRCHRQPTEKKGSGCVPRSRWHGAAQSSSQLRCFRPWNWCCQALSCLLGLVPGPRPHQVPGRCRCRLSTQQLRRQRPRRTRSLQADSPSQARLLYRGP